MKASARGSWVVMPASGPADAGAVMTRSGVAFGLLQAAAVLAWMVQLGLSPVLENVLSATIVLASSTATFQALRISRSFATQPFSSFAALGLCLTTQWGALVAQSCAWTPVADNLRTPVETFALLAGYQMVAVTAVWLSAHLAAAKQAKRFIADRLLTPLGIFDVPSAGNLWCIGGMGFVAIVGGAGLNGEGGVAGKLLDSCRFLAWAPFIIPVLASKHAGYCDRRKHLIGLAVYALGVVGLGMAVNARSIMFIGVMTVALLSLMLTLGSDSPVKRSSLMKIVPAAIVAAMGIGYASDLAIATVIVRDQRNSAGPLEMIELTVGTLFNPQVIDTFKDSIDTYSKVALYDEYYIANQVLTRLIETKFHDNMFFLSAQMQPQEVEVLRQHAIDSAWATLPEPVLHLLGISIDKAGLGFSVGDLFDYLHYGHDLGGFKIGSIFAHGQALFGPWFFAVYLLMCLFVFISWDSFSKADAAGAVRYAPVALLSVWGIFFNTISGDSIIVIFGFLLRGTVQTVLVYAAVYAASKLAFQPHRSFGDRPAAAPVPF